MHATKTDQRRPVPLNARDATHINRIHVLGREYPVLALHILAVNCEREVLGHDTVVVNDLYTCRLEVAAKVGEWFVPVELRTECESTGPRKDGRDGVRGRLPSLLVLAIMARHGACAEESNEGAQVACQQPMREHQHEDAWRTHRARPRPR